MAAKKSEKESRGRKWSEDELKEFASVLVDDRTEFALTLETLALKTSANVHIFEAMKKELDARLQAKTTTSSKKGKAKDIDTSVVKLRVKYKWLKEQWRKYTDRAKSGSGKSAIDEPEWFNIMNPILSETHTELKVATKAADIESDGTCSSEDDEYSDNYKEDKTEVTMAKRTSAMMPREKKQALNSSSSSAEASSEHLTVDESDEEFNRNNLTHTRLTNAGSVRNRPTTHFECQPTDADHDGTSIEEDEVVLKRASKKDKKEVQKSSVSVRPRKRKITSQKDAISQLSTTFENLQKAQDKRIQTWLEADQRREEAFLKYQEKQAELNRQHELRMMEMMARFQQPVQPYQNA
ncbi:unnamed protein product [Porites lobata]|uniref:Uncharacterized protein n=1 Tax=Porites lobata TaxID=104759 RepID=A0ABN8QXE5_9CNID|nr:unnamed protein product [Porites lobata]